MDNHSLQSPQAHCLKCNDLQILNRYNSFLETQLKYQHIFKQLTSLQNEIHGNWITKSQVWEFKNINHVVTGTKLAAERQCHKLKIGNVPWCPSLTKAIQQILYWKGVLTKTCSGHIGTSVLRCRAKKAGLVHDLQQITRSKTELQDKIKKAFQKYNWLKKNDLQCDTWLGQLIEAQAAAYNKKKAALWKQLHAIKCIWVMAYQVKHALGQDKQFRALAVVNATFAQGNRRDFTSQVDLE